MAARPEYDGATASESGGRAAILDLGIFSNGQRHNAVAARSYAEDLYEIVTADRLGYREAWVSEHIGVHRQDTQPAPELLLAAAAVKTRHIRLGVAVRGLPLFHPIDVAMQASACDHLTRGRYLFGFGAAGTGSRQMQQRGLEFEERHARMEEALDLILKCWTSPEPFDYEGQFYRGSGINMLPKPYQKPHPPMAMATETDDYIEFAARRGYAFFMSQYENRDTLRHKASVYRTAAQAAGIGAANAKLNICRNVYVSDSVEQAKRELRATAGQDMDDIRTHFPRLFAHHMPPSGRIDDVNFDQLIDAGMFIVGDPDTVYEGIQSVYDAVGGFGLLMVVMGKDWGSRANRARSLRLLKEEVGPRLAALH
jgi:alkanesulfonate monooxygenase SsuD/methylene tetrahydromethanopterin reductase-like flavin-dependent oxidoreductase (luciferase family)